jgi:hypothetical protein
MPIAIPAVRGERGGSPAGEPTPRRGFLPPPEWVA